LPIEVNATNLLLLLKLLLLQTNKNIPQVLKKIIRNEHIKQTLGFTMAEQIVDKMMNKL